MATLWDVVAAVLDGLDAGERIQEQADAHIARSCTACGVLPRKHGTLCVVCHSLAEDPSGLSAARVVLGGVAPKDPKAQRVVERLRARVDAKLAKRREKGDG